MKYKHHKIITLAFLIIIFYGCLDEDAKKDEIIDPGYQEIKFYMVGDGPLDLPLIESEINILANKDLNLNVKFNFTTWTEYMKTYDILLTSGRPIDLIFTTEWLNYKQYAQKGAFMELDDLLPLYAPDLYNFIPEEFWEAVKVNGHIYTIPSTWIEYVNEGFLYREDLRKKYKLPEPVNLETIELYLEGIRKNEPDRILMSELVIDNSSGPFFSAASVLNIKYNWVNFNIPYGLNTEYSNPMDLELYWESEDFVTDMKMFKRWADKGFWSKSVLTNNNGLHASFINDYSIAVLSGVNPLKFNRTVTLFETRSAGGEVGYYPYSRSTGIVHPVHPIHNGFAIPISSKNPEDALRFYEKLVLDTRYNHLTHYGIEGTHYSIDSGGYYSMIGDLKSNGFTRESMNSWAWRNPDNMLYDRHFDKIKDLFTEFDEYAQPDLYSDFIEDYSSYQAERAALHQVQSQYLVPLQAGLVDDVDEAIKAFLDKAYSAGLQTIIDNYKQQWDDYCTEKGIK